MSGGPPRRPEHLTVAGSGGLALDARLDRPGGPPRAAAVVAPCFTCTKESHASARIARGLVERGVAVLRFDFAGLGGSAGEFADTTFEGNVGDLVAAATALGERFDLPQLLVGHSLGGAVAVAAAERLPRVCLVATVNAPFRPSHLLGNLPAAAVEALRRGEAAEVTVEIGGRPYRLGRRFVDDLDARDPGPALAGLGRALIVFHAPGDATVAVDNARRIFEAARHPKSFVSLDRADHLLSRPADAAYVAGVLAAWVDGHLPAAAAPATAPPAAPPGEREVVVEESGAGRYAQRVRAGRHELGADEPLGVGDDTGPSPYDLLLASLGACTSMTIRMYAERKGWDVGPVRVRLAHRREHTAGSGGTEADRATVEVFDVHVEVGGELDDARRARLAEIAGRCPVHRTLTGTVRVETTLEGA